MLYAETWNTTLWHMSSYGFYMCLPLDMRPQSVLYFQLLRKPESIQSEERPDNIKEESATVYYYCAHKHTYTHSDSDQTG